MKGESDFAHMLFVDEEHFYAPNVGVGSKIIVLLRALSRTKKKLMKRLYNIELKMLRKVILATITLTKGNLR